MEDFKVGDFPEFSQQIQYKIVNALNSKIKECRKDVIDDIKIIEDKLDWAKNIRGSDGFLIDIRNICDKYTN